MGRKKIEIKKIEDSHKRVATFRKRRDGLFKKALELHRLTGAHVTLSVVHRSQEFHFSSRRKFERPVSPLKHFDYTDTGIFKSNGIVPSCKTPCEVSYDTEEVRPNATASFLVVADLLRREFPDTCPTVLAKLLKSSGDFPLSEKSDTASNSCLTRQILSITESENPADSPRKHAKERLAELRYTLIDALFQKVLAQYKDSGNCLQSSSKESDPYHRSAVVATASPSVLKSFATLLQSPVHSAKQDTRTTVSVSVGESHLKPIVEVPLSGHSMTATTQTANGEFTSRIWPLEISTPPPESTCQTLDSHPFSSSQSIATSWTPLQFDATSQNFANDKSIEVVTLDSVRLPSTNVSSWIKQGRQASLSSASTSSFDNSDVTASSATSVLSNRLSPISEVLEMLSAEEFSTTPTTLPSCAEADTDQKRHPSTARLLDLLNNESPFESLNSASSRISPVLSRLEDASTANSCTADEVVDLNRVFAASTSSVNSNTSFSRHRPNPPSSLCLSDFSPSQFLLTPSPITTPTA